MQIWLLALYQQIHAGPGAWLCGSAMHVQAGRVDDFINKSYRKEKERNMKKLCGIIASTSFLLSGCSSVTTEDYIANTPKLDIRHYLNGPLEAHGILFGMSGKANLSFYVKMTGKWEGNTGTLEEYFTYSDGRKDARTWTITFSDDHHFTATAHDVIGEAKGTQHGNSMNMRYLLNAKRASGDMIKLSMDDWMYLLDDNILINRTKMRKFGLTVGELVITFKKL